MPKKKNTNNKTGMNVVIGYPPNYKKIAERFNIHDKPVCFTYGNTIYNPKNGPIAKHLIAHEATHKFQQGGEPEVWWDRYMMDDKFRLEQEIEAYRNQYKYFIAETKNREIQNKFLFSIARDLSSPIYGNVITHSEAMKCIKSR